MKSFLRRGNGEGDLYIFSDCVNMIEEFRTYRWQDGDTPLKRDDHCMDELRYYAMTRPRPAEKREELSVIAADKRRRIRRKKGVR